MTITTLFHYAYRTSLDVLRRHRLYTVAIFVAALVATTALTAVLSLLAMLAHQDARQQARSAVLAGPDQQPQLLALLRGAELPNGPISVIWLQPLTSTPPVPPGLDRLPEPGTYALSPALAEIVRAEPEVAALFPQVSATIRHDGLRQPGELIVYAGVPLGKSIAAEDAVLKVITFSGEAARGQRVMTTGARETHVPIQIGLVGLGLLGAPALLLIAVALRLSAGSRDYKLLILQWLGASRTQIATAAAIPPIVLATAAALVASGGWALLAANATRFPLLDMAAQPGDLRLDAVTHLSITAVVVALFTIVALAVTKLPDTTANRPVVAGDNPSRWRIALAVIACVAAVGATIMGGRTGGQVLIAATIALTLAAPFLLPSVLRAVGARAARAGWVPLHLAGRRLQWSSATVARPVVGIATLAVLVPAIAGFLQVVRVINTGGSGLSGTAAYVDYVDPRSGDLAAFADLEFPAIVAPISSTDDSGVVLSVDCADVVQMFGGRCVAVNGMTEIDSAWVRTALARGGPVYTAPAAEQAPSASLVVLSRDDALAAVRAVAARDLVAAMVYDLLDPPPLREPRVTFWLLRTLAVAAAILAVACALAATDRLRHGGPQTLLARLGAAPGRLVDLQVVEGGLTLSAAVTVGLGAGTASAAMIVAMGEVEQPWALYATLWAAAVTAILLITLMISLAATRENRRVVDLG